MPWLKLRPTVASVGKLPLKEGREAQALQWLVIRGDGFHRFAECPGSRAGVSSFVLDIKEESESCFRPNRPIPLVRGCWFSAAVDACE